MKLLKIIFFTIAGILTVAFLGLKLYGYILAKSISSDIERVFLSDLPDGDEEKLGNALLKAIDGKRPLLVSGK